MGWSVWSRSALSEDPVRVYRLSDHPGVSTILLRLYFELIGLCARLAPVLPKLSVPVENCLRIGPTSLTNRGPEESERQESGA